jgi:hypothetical protein
VEIEGRFGRRSFSWADLGGCYLRRRPPGAATVEGAPVRVGLYSGLAPDPDVLSGVVEGLDERTLTLGHPQLGKLKLPRSILHDLRPGAGEARGPR